MINLAVLSMHSSPLSPLGTGDGGGMSVYIRESSKELAKFGINVDVFTAGNRDDTEIDLDSGMAVHYVDIGQSSFHKQSLESRIDVFTHRVESRIEKLGGADIMHAHYWLSGASGHQLKHRLGIPLVSTFHTLGKVKALTKTIIESAERIKTETEIIGCADAVLASTCVESAELTKLYDADSGKVRTVSPGVDRSIYTPGGRQFARKRLGLHASRPMAVFVGRIQTIKGPQVAIDAMQQVVKRLPDAMLYVVGEPSGEDGFATLRIAKEAVQAAGLGGNVHFVDAQSPLVIADYFRAANVCVVPSYAESFGLVALEASSCGIPVVASAVGGLRVIVDHGRTGYLVDSGDVDAFASGIKWVMSNPEQAALMGEAGAHRSAHYTWRRMAEQMSHLYLDLLVSGVESMPSDACSSA